MLGLSGIKDSYHLANGGSTGLLTGSDAKSFMVSVRLRHAFNGSHRFCRTAIQVDQRPMQIPVLRQSQLYSTMAASSAGRINRAAHTLNHVISWARG
jgi:hypothetical protein